MHKTISISINIEGMQEDLRINIIKIREIDIIIGYN